MKQFKKNEKQVMRGAALAFALSCSLAGAAGAEEAVVAPDTKQVPAALAATDVPLTEVEVQDKKESAKPEPEGSAKSGYRVRTVQAGALGKLSLQDTPYSISVASAELLENIQAQSVADALKYNPTVQSVTGNSRVTDYYVIRGFSSSIWTNNVALDGMRSYDIIEPIEDKERIEVMNGSGSFLFGMASPGGMINYVTKRPTDAPVNTVTLGNYGGGQSYVHGDFGGRLTEDGSLTYRLNVLKVNGGDIGVEHQTNGRSLFSAAVDWRVNPATVWSFDASHFERDLEYAQALFMIGSASVVPDAPDSSKNWGAPYSFAKDSYTRYGTSITSKLNDTFSVRAALRHSTIDRSYATYRQSWVNNAYDYKLRMDYQGNYQTVADQGNVYLDADFNTGTVKHKLTFGWAKDSVDYNYPLNGTKTYTSSTVYSSSLFSDNPSYAPDPAQVIGSGSPYRTTRKTNLDSILLSDQITLDERWSMLVGANYLKIDDQNWALATGAKTSFYNDSKTTPSVAVMYKPIPDITVYTSYVEALQQGLTAPTGTANAGTALAPYVGRQLEFGVKSKLGQMDVNAALFTIKQQSGYTDSVTNVYSMAGREDHDGVEVSASGKVSKYLTIGGGFTVLDATIKKTSTASLLNKTPQGVAEKMARLYAEYAIPSMPGLTLTGGISYTGKAWIDTANTLSAPSYVVGDLGARYQFKAGNGQDVTLRLNVNNITGKNYWTTRSGILYLGNPRTVSLSAEVKL